MTNSYSFHLLITVSLSFVFSECVCTFCVCTADSTGTHSLYTAYQDYEIMFHVSTMLPYMPNNPQQVGNAPHTHTHTRRRSEPAGPDTLVFFVFFFFPLSNSPQKFDFLIKSFLLQIHICVSFFI